MNQYMAIAKHVEDWAKASGDAAWQIVMQMNGSDYQALSLYKRASRSHDEVFKVQHEGSEAYTCCMRQVGAREASLAKERRAESQGGSVFKEAC